MRLLSGLCLIALVGGTGSSAGAQRSPVEVETERYLSCLERVETDREEAFEDALAWRMEGGGWPAAHCEARALIALGNGASGAAKLEEQANALANGRDVSFRISMLVEAGETWLALRRPEDAMRTFAAALELAPLERGALLGRARASLALGQWDAAENAAAASITQQPGLADGWHLRARARLERGALDAAWRDMEAAREIEPENIDLLVLRGRISEARRLAGQGN